MDFQDAIPNIGCAPVICGQGVRINAGCNVGIGMTETG
jgi:hypothetical protein